MEWVVEAHCHTTASDGRPTPAELVRAARARGLAGLAVTDHDTLAGYRAALPEARSLGLLLVPAVEVRTREGDVLVYCPSDPGEPPRLPGVEELAEWASTASCILVPAHPYHPVRSSIGGRALHAHARLWAAVEAWNSRGPPPFNLPAVRAARRLGLPATSGSDAHVLSELATSPLRLQEEPRTPEDFIEAVRRGRARPTYGVPSLRAIAEAAAWGVEKRLSRRRRG